MPICLDLGTNTKKYLEDPLYIGVRRERPQGKEVSTFGISLHTCNIYKNLQMDEFMEEFMLAMRDVFPKLLVQFEDFSTDNAFKYLDVFRNRYRVFNDDVSAERRFADSMKSSFTPPLVVDPRHWCRSALRLYQCRSYRLCRIRTAFDRPPDIVLRCRVSWSWCRETATFVLHHQRAEPGGSEEAHLHGGLQRPDHCG